MAWQAGGVFVWTKHENEQVETTSKWSKHKVIPPPFSELKKYILYFMAVDYRPNLSELSKFKKFKKFGLFIPLV